MKHPIKTPLAVTLLSGLASAAYAELPVDGSNPFALKELGAGYMQTAENQAAGDAPADGSKTPEDMKKMEGSCGEGKCGASMKKGDSTGSGDMQVPKSSSDTKAMEGKCAGMKK